MKRQHGRREKVGMCHKAGGGGSRSAESDLGKPAGYQGFHAFETVVGARSSLLRMNRYIRAVGTHTRGNLPNGAS